MVKAVEVLHLLRAAEDDRCHSFFDDARARPVLRLIDLRIALALAPEEGTNDGRPAEVDGMREVKDIVVPVPVRLLDVVGHSITEVDAVAAQDDCFLRSASALLELDLEEPWELFLFRKAVVE